LSFSWHFSFLVLLNNGLFQPSPLKTAVHQDIRKKFVDFAHRLNYFEKCWFKALKITVPRTGNYEPQRPDRYGRYEGVVSDHALVLD
jgi:hypothetical protein